VERVRHELELIFAEAQPERAICRLAGLDVLKRLHEALRCDAWFTAKAVELRATLENFTRAGAAAAWQVEAERIPQFYLVLLLYNTPAEAAAEFLEKYHVRAEYRALVMESLALRAKMAVLERSDLPASQIVALLDGSSDAARLILRVACDQWLVRQRLDLYQRRLRFISPELDGDDLRRLGVPPGRIYRQLLQQLRAERLDGIIRTREDEEALVRRQMERHE
jgi:tRNA nucleotidyltransferase (CCA-adding enzyme)